MYGGKNNEGCNAVLMTNILIGVVSGIVASITYAFCKALLRPRIDIWDFVCVNRNNDGRRFVVVKLVNRSRVRVVDINCRMQYYQRLSDGSYRSIELDPIFTTQPAFERYVNDNNERNAASLYAVQIGYWIADDNVRLAPEDKFVFSFMGTHSVSGTTIYKTVEFSCANSKDVLENKKFKTGINKGYYDIV